jgi:hypothetical protein
MSISLDEIKMIADMADSMNVEISLVPTGFLLRPLGSDYGRTVTWAEVDSRLLSNLRLAMLGMEGVRP